MSDFTVHCPKCGSDKIRAKREAYAEVEVFAWTLDDGIPIADDCNDESFPDWEPADLARQFACYVCRWEGNSDDLKIREVPGQLTGHDQKSPEDSK